MNRLTSISIPEPCHQQWLQMTPVDGGRHCESCCKTVVDFTIMTDVEVVAYLSFKNDVCGRFDELQLSRVNLQLHYQDAKPQSGWKKWVMTAAFLASTAFYKAAGQTAPVTPKAEQTSDNCPGGVIKKNVPAAKERGTVIEGRIVDEVGTPLPGATVRAVGVDIAQPSDTNGYFKLHLPKAVTQFTVSYIGFETETIVVDSLQNGIQDLQLTPQIVSMNSVVVTGYTSHRRADISGGVVSIRSEMVTKRHCWLWRMYYKYIRTPIHNIFY